MQNLMETSTRKDSRRRNTKQHVFVMGIIITVKLATNGAIHISFVSIPVFW